MKRKLLASAALTAVATSAMAGGVERSSQSVAILFEQGRYAELSFGTFSPDVSGGIGPGFALRSGDMSSTYTTYSLGYKMDIGESLDFALIIDQPIGADVAYPTGSGYPLQGSTAELTSSALTALLRYKFENNLSVYGGLRYQTVHGEVSLPLFSYTLDTNYDSELGYVVGVAWERPDIAARVALTYNSAITHTLAATEVSPLGTSPSSFDTEVPQSLNLEFQTGIAKDTLLFGSIRWQEWSAFVIDPPGYQALPGTTTPLVSYASDRITYNLGIGRRFNENWSGAVTVGYEPSDGEVTGNLGPTDGFSSIGLAATYTMDKVKVTGGIRYVDIGDAVTNIGGNFQNNHGIGIGIRVGYTF
jgi:long-subunit fatty acid transport protein